MKINNKINVHENRQVLSCNSFLLGTETREVKFSNNTLRIGVTKLCRLTPDAGSIFLGSSTSTSSPLDVLLNIFDEGTLMLRRGCLRYYFPILKDVKNEGAGIGGVVFTAIEAGTGLKKLYAAKIREGRDRALP